MRGRGFLVVEGHGETLAALNLITRLWADLRLPPCHWDSPPIRGKALHTRAGIQQAVELVRRKQDVGALLILRDEDDACPKTTGPETSSWVAEAGLTFPAAVVLLRREFETIFLPSIHRMAGAALIDPRGVSRPGIKAGSRFEGDPESIRDAKRVVSSFYGKGRYKPSTDQLALTRMINFADVRAANVPAFGTLEHALSFLAVPREGTPVYPPPVTP